MHMYKSIHASTRPWCKAYQHACAGFFCCIGICRCSLAFLECLPTSHGISPPEPWQHIVLWYHPVMSEMKWDQRGLHHCSTPWPATPHHHLEKPWAELSRLNFTIGRVTCGHMWSLMVPYCSVGTSPVLPTAFAGALTELGSWGDNQELNPRPSTFNPFQPRNFVETNDVRMA